MNQPSKRKSQKKPSLQNQKGSQASRAAKGRPSAKQKSIKAAPKATAKKTPRKPAAAAPSARAKHSHAAAGSGHAAAGGHAAQPHGKADKKRTPPASYATASMLWTKEPPKKNEARSFPMRVLAGIGGVFVGLFKGIGWVFKSIAGAIASLMQRSKLAAIAIVLVLLLAVAGAVDFGLNWGKVYPGVSVGEVDLGGKTADEARALIKDTYEQRLNGTNVSIYASDEASQHAEETKQQAQDASQDEQASVEEARANKQLWTTDASMLSATLDTDGLVQEALAYGRQDGGIFNRIGAALFGHRVEPRAVYAGDSIEHLAADIDSSISSPRVNYNIAVEGGVASVTPGNDGYMIDRAGFERELDKAFFETGGADVSFVAHADYAPLQITQEDAQATCDRVNAAIGKGIQFVYEGAGLQVDPAEMGNWISTRIEQKGDGWELVPFIDYQKAKSAIFSSLKARFDGDSVSVSFLVEDGTPYVVTDAKGTVPLASAAVDALNESLFPEGGSAVAPVEQPSVTVQSVPLPDKLALSDALDYGVVSKFAEYTTEYTTGSTNRNHNIHLVADRLNNSVAKAGGGEWSFNGVAGDCNAEAGFLGAGAIVNGEYVDDIGGGICQVATTVFNAAYNAGFPITQRRNHSLYIASYPAGRDAAVSWPDLDLKWENDSDSDVLLSMGYTDSTVTAALYGVSPGYKVSTETGNWEEGKKFAKKTVVDDTLPDGYRYVKTEGVDGSKITVVRTVKDAQGTIVSQDAFASEYDPKDEVTVVGPGGGEASSETASSGERAA